jgi:uncharacterized membrane protein YsdA (DUF1294 family)
MECFVFLLILGAYVFALLYLNAKAQPGQNRIPERLKPVKYFVNSVGLMFVALLLFMVSIVVLISISCLLFDCPRIE